jgi:hypothetical protein
VNINAIHATAVAVGSTNFTQNVAPSVDLVALGGFVQMMLRELPVPEMNDDHKEGARAALSEAQHELERDKPDRNRVGACPGLRRT